MRATPRTAGALPTSTPSAQDHATARPARRVIGQPSRSMHATTPRRHPRCDRPASTTPAATSSTAPHTPSSRRATVRPTTPTAQHTLRTQPPSAAQDTFAGVWTDAPTAPPVFCSGAADGTSAQTRCAPRPRARRATCSRSRHRATVTPTSYRPSPHEHQDRQGRSPLPAAPPQAERSHRQIPVPAVRWTARQSRLPCGRGGCRKRVLPAKDRRVARLM
jgi:hypothetical protein